MKIVVLVLLCAVSFAFAQECTSNCDKVSNATVCVDYNGPNAAYDLMGAFSKLKFEQLDSNTYSACISLPLHTKVCVNVDFEDAGDFFTNLTLSITIDGITVWSTEATLPQLMQENGGVCIDDNTILEILALIPEFQDQAEIILRILEITGCEPRGLFSMCFYFQNCTSTASLALTSGICGCFQFDFQLLYWRDYCVYKDVADLGCVGTPAPRPHPVPLGGPRTALKFATSKRQIPV